jgi:hypothetical protein
LTWSQPYIVVNSLTERYFNIDLNNTGGPRYMREIGTQQIGSNIMNSNIKKTRITVNLRIGLRKMAISQLHICKIADKKVAYNEGRLCNSSIQSEAMRHRRHFLKLI